MFSSEKTKRTILEIINNPPTYEDMLADLQMHNIRVLHKSGDVHMEPAMNKSMVEHVWRSYKINTILEEHARQLKTKGIKSSVVYQNIDMFLKEFETQISKTQDGSPKGLFDDGYVEFEIYNPGRKTSN